MQRRRNPFAVLELALEIGAHSRGETRILVESMAEADVQAILSRPDILVGSDGPNVRYATAE